MPVFLSIDAIFCLTIKVEFVKSPYEFIVLISHSQQNELSNNPFNKNEGGERGMNKSDLVESMAKAAGISKAAAEKGLNGMLDAVTKALKKGDKVTLVGFGTFSVAKRAARQGRNPQTGNMIKIAAKKVAKFKAGSKLADAVK
jgi:DNA-binding protein HU-beta